MKVTLDLDQLLAEGKITPDEYDKFSQFAARDTASLAFNILVGFGVVAVSGAALALLPTATTATVLGVVICVMGIAVTYARAERWRVLATICVVVGALLFGGGVIVAGDGSVISLLIVAAAFVAGGIVARNALLIVLAVLALASCIGARTGYSSATYFLGINEPTLTVVLFSAFSVATYQLAKRLAAEDRGLALAAARTGLILVNFGFWIGSLWGDSLEAINIVIPDWAFAIVWAIGIVAMGAWGWRNSRRWVVNAAAIFGGIHFSTQWFERLGASPGTVLIGGLLALGLAVGWRAVNAELATTDREAPV